MDDEKEYQTILEEVKARKRKAVELGIHKYLRDIFFGYGICGFIGNEVAWVPSVSNFSMKWYDWHRCKFTFNNKDYEVINHKNKLFLELFVNRERVYAIKFKKERMPSSLPPVYILECQDIEAFVDGEWVQDIKEIAAQKEKVDKGAYPGHDWFKENTAVRVEIKELEDKVKQDEKELASLTKIKNLIKDFGIE